MTLHSAQAVAAAANPDLVIDGRLAFSECGPLLCLALAEDRRCWLVQGLWALLQRHEVIDYPEFADSDEDAPAMLARVREWHEIWTKTTRLERFCWLGDMLFESRLPLGFDQVSAERTRAFASWLEQLVPADIPLTALTLCGRDAAALAAVNAVAAPVILTIAEPTRPPRLCEFLSAARLPCEELRGSRAERLLDRALGHRLPMAVELALLSGVSLAVVSILAPRAVAFALEEPDFDTDDIDETAARAAWQGASVVWAEVAA